MIILADILSATILFAVPLLLVALTYLTLVLVLTAALEHFEKRMRKQ